MNYPFTCSNLEAFMINPPIVITFTDEGDVHFAQPASWGLDDLLEFEPVLTALRAWQAHRMDNRPSAGTVPGIENIRELGTSA